MGKERVSLSRKIMQKVNESIVKINRFETLVAELAIEKKYDYVICGHIHQPARRVIQTEKGTVTYLNSGDWVEHLTALEYYDKKWQLYQYDEAVMKTLEVKETKTEPDMMTSEIAMYLHSLGV
jgi:UDP-2,3-diacylglucosamine pyrophosphatase LpxH